ncbi:MULTISPECIES: hypothetical protein [Streptomyces]|uniref:Lipoprotein n=3 Tax=Streptomyces TaxID=1883 RepID=A0A8H9LTG7_9ACTN|nr:MULTISPECIES: hypothetical protein [Streptomyces]NEE27352.1 hypothetical protein [Streptomyces sp. SID7982]NEE49296.1 hypothetical protein [Streptomyces sp. SID8455]MBL3806013.1 hypothetical protein [Streptomyces sp. BRB081]MDQ0294396.1 hypothetical protein [Streptomyces sp. DSM 41037]RPK90912.1 hypothetical protein EES47_07325 [Streptomyces sp. ADI98-12]
MWKPLRISAAASAAALLLLTGCGSDGDSSGSGTGKHKGGGHGSDAGDDDQGGTGGESAAPGSADGAWQATVDGRSYFLTITRDQAATIGEATCAGTFQDQALALKCADGSTDRARGKAELGADGKTLTVSWEGAGEDTFARVDPGELPTDLPSSLPTELPSGLPTGEVTTR